MKNQTAQLPKCSCWALNPVKFRRWRKGKWGFCLDSTLFGIGPFLCLLSSFTGWPIILGSLSSPLWNENVGLSGVWSVYSLPSAMFKWFFKCLIKICPCFLLPYHFPLRADELNFYRVVFVWSNMGPWSPHCYSLAPAPSDPHPMLRFTIAFCLKGLKKHWIRKSLCVCLLSCFSYVQLFETL